MSEQELVFTGERFLPDCEREIWYEHYHRYAMASHWVEGKDVLDAACGEGYGSHLLAQQANSVTGVDIDPQAIAHAQKTYQQDHLTFITSDVLTLPLESDTYDVIVSFETLEHLSEHQQLLAEFKRVLKPGGVLLISTPDKREYSDKTGFDNEYHVRELYREEFEQLINSNFSHSQWFGQKLMFSSNIWRLDQPANRLQQDHMVNQQLTDGAGFAPMYYVVAASDQPMTEANHPDAYQFTEQDETVYGHYNAVIRAHIKAEQDCMALQNRQERWLSHPLIGRLIKWFGKE
ncbi:class I SAM-dependent methyltransferase [Marinicella sediminis]|uniref:Class I SAM-dependent methyltransferase n=1 Tax=Marinicella sediminis TaxID=1792834 RepID=A0ABV7J4Y3_9GAMM|nr:class I SAM-dependent methyltransferase [Marinicella sediminis]